MLPLSADMEALYDASGCHLGGIYSPLMVDGKLTETHAGCLATRPAERLIWYGALCSAPTEHLALVWMAPVGVNPLVVSPAVLPYLVQALDAGTSVQLHASSEEAINATCAALSPLLGGGHA